MKTINKIQSFLRHDSEWDVNSFYF
ncbi:MAG: hypothetical protein RLZZ205_1178, partial [Bacteroidota bacterium]